MPSTNQNRVVVAVFAHPDDEAFGPSGTIAKLSKTHDVYVLCATRGEAGKSETVEKNLANVRSKELLKSAKILGVKKVFFLGFVDGMLSNSLYHALASKIESKLLLLRPQKVITLEPRGISGHIDHITVSFVTTYVFYRLPFIKELHYYCISEENRVNIDNYFIYFPPGYKKNEIDQVINIQKEWPTKVKAMMAHKSQVHDAKLILRRLEKLPKEEYFLVLKNR